MAAKCQLRKVWPPPDAWLGLGFLALCCCHATTNDSQKKRIDVSRSDQQIIEELESYTPLGSPAEDVLSVIRSRFRDGGIISSIGVGESSSWDGGSSIEMTIGFSRKTFPAVEVVAGDWLFDRFRVLRKIKVRRYMSEGEPRAPRRIEPIVFIDPNLTNSEIREKLLHYTPIGVPFEEVTSFRSRLRYVSGQANVISWNGRHGFGVILAILPKGNGRYVDVRVIWVRNEQGKLEDIEVQRVNFVPKAAPEEVKS